MVWAPGVGCTLVNKQPVTIYPDQKSGSRYCDFTNRCRIDGVNHTTVTDLNRINFVYLFYSFSFQQALIKICWLFPNYSVNYQNPYFMHLLHEIRSFFGQDLDSFLMLMLIFRWALMWCSPARISALMDHGTDLDVTKVKQCLLLYHHIMEVQGLFILLFRHLPSALLWGRLSLETKLVQHSLHSDLTNNALNLHVVFNLPLWSQKIVCEFFIFCAIYCNCEYLNTLDGVLRPMQICIYQSINWANTVNHFDQS